jgi:phosphoribosylanthranilate isomerase
VSWTRSLQQRELRESSSDQAVSGSGRLPYGCIQVAGIIDLEEAWMLVDSGVRLLGFPFGLPVHSEDTSVEAAGVIARSVSSRALSILITYLERPAEILALGDCLGCGGIQLHGRMDPEDLRELRTRRPDLLLIRSLIVGMVEPEELIETMRLCAPHVDAFLTDSFDPASGAQGATGRTHDWEISRKLAESAPRPLVLAGGLTPENVARAIWAVRPHGVDAHTGLEGPDGRKDRVKVAAFVSAARQAFAANPREHAL